MATVTNGTSTVPVEIVAARLRRPLRREAIGLLNVAAPQIQAGTPALLAGQITYLTTTLADALALDAIYAALNPLTLNASAIEVRRNQATVPTPVDTTGWNANNPALYPVTYDSAGGRRPGTGARKSTRVAGTPNTTLASVSAAGNSAWNTAGRVPVTPGEVWTLSAYVKASVAFRAAIIQVSFFDSSGTQIGFAGPSVHQNGAAGEWVRPYITVTVPAGAVNMGILNLGAYLPSGSSAGGEETWMTDALIEKSPDLGAFFSGGYTPDADLTPAWLGTPAASASILTRADLEAGLSGLKHSGVGTTEMVAEKPPPGRSARWLYSVDVVEVP